MKRLSSVATSLCLALLASPVAMAHPGHYHPGEEDEFDALTAGFLHPLSGWDHLLLALAAGWLAASLVKGGRLVGATAFLLTLFAGAVAGRLSPSVSGLQLALAATALAAGTMVLVTKSGAPAASEPVPLKRSWFAALLALGGFVHGLAHGTEAPAGTPFALSAIGFVAGTAFLVASGAALKAVMAKTGPWVSRAAGAALIGAGSFFVIQAL